MTTSIVAPSLSNLQVNTWTPVYSSAPAAGFSGTVRIVAEIGSGNIKLSNSSTGVTTSTGYGNLYDGSANSIAFEGTLSQVNAALQSLQVYNSNANANPTLNISAVRGGQAYNPNNGHYYEYIKYGSTINGITINDTTWTAAENAARYFVMKFNGLDGYLTTITSQQENDFIVAKVGGNAWIGANDVAVEGEWRWVTGPEAGTLIMTEPSDGNNPVYNTSPYYSWQTGEPNNGGGTEDYAQLISSNTGGLVAGKWNDLNNTGGGGDYTVTGFVIEYGGIGTPIEAAATSSTTLTVQATPDITSNGSGASASISYAENGTLAVTTVTATDADSGDSKTYSITGGADAALFNIGSSNGALTFKTSPDYEGVGDNSYEVKARVTDSTGLYDEQTLTVNVTDVNDNAPVFTSGTTGNVAENAATSTVIYDAATTDADGTATNQNLAYSLKGDGSADDAELLNINSTTGEVTLKASANYEAKNSYTFTVVATNVGTGATLGAEQAVTVSVTNVNEAPSITKPASQTVNEDASIGITGLSFGDGDASNDLLRATLSVSHGTLTLAGTTGITVDAGANGSATMTVSGTRDAISTAVATLTYAPVTDYNGSDPLNISVTDSGNVGTGGVLTSTDTLAITVTSVNDAPMFTSAAVSLSYADTGAVDTFAAPDSGSTSGTLTAQDDHSGAPSEDGTLTFGVSGGTVASGISSVTGTYGTMSVNTSTGAYTFTPNATAINALRAGATAAPTYTLTVSDGQGGSATQTLTVNLSGANDAPVGTDGSVTLLEDSTGTAITAAQLGFTDPVDGTDDALAAVQITTLPAKGSLTLDGVAVVAGVVIAVADINANKLLYTPAANENGSSNASFTFQVQDDGGTANGGVDLDPTPNTFTIHVDPVNDAPVLSGTGADMTGLNEDAVTDDLNAGQTVASLLATITDTDTTLGSTTHGTDNGLLTGVVIYSTTVNGPSTGGKWQYKVDGGNWTDVGSVSGTSALLLKANDYVRLLPDGKNGQTASFDYYAWDQAMGSTGSKVDVSTRGTTTPFSTGSDKASISVTAVNDAPALDLDGNNSSTATGTGFTTVFRPLGQSAALVDSDVLISDVDKLGNAANQTDTLTTAKVFIATGALNNIGTTKYETLSSTTGSSFTATSGAVISISGNGISSTSPLTLTGAGTWADYQEALQTLRYQNTSDSAVAGNRTISITVTDAAVTTGDDDDRLPSAVATSTAQVIWAPVQDLNGSVVGKTNTTTYVEDTTGIHIAASDAVINSGATVKSLVATLKNPQDGATGDAESLYIDATTVTTLQGVGFTITGNGTHTLSLMGDLDKSLYGLALQAIQYKNTSQNPSTDARTVEVTVTDVNEQAGAPVVSTINITPVNDAPSAIALSASTISLTADGIQNVTATAAVEVATINVTDVDNSTHTLSVGGSDAALFEVVNGKLLLKAGTTLDATAKPSYAVNVTADDGGVLNNTLTESFIIQVTEAVAPLFSIAAVKDKTLTLYYQDSSRLDPTKVPAASAFTVPGYTVSAVSIPDDTSKTMVLTLNAAPTGAVTVSYTAPESNPVQDTSGNKAASLTSASVVSGTVSRDSSLTVTTTSGGTVPAPLGDFTLVNDSTNPVTVTGVTAGQTVTVSGTGNTLVQDPAGNLTVNNNGTGTVTVNGLNTGSKLTVKGSSPTTINNPDGSLSVDNTGTGLVTVSGDLAGDTLTIDGTGSGPVAINNTGSTAVTVASVNDGQTITASGSGPTTIHNPDGSLSVDNTGTGLVTVIGNLAGDTLTIDGTGTGPVAINNTGSTAVIVTGVNNAQAITASGTGPTTISNPDGSLSVDNTGLGAVTVTSLNDGVTLMASGTGPNTVSNPDGSLTVANGGTGTVTVNGLKDGTTLTISGTGPTLISDPAGDLSIANSGEGTVTVAGLKADAVLQTTGAKHIIVDLSHLTSGQTITIDNDGSGLINLVNVPEGVTVLTAGGTGTGGINYAPTISGVPGAAQDVTASSTAALADFTVGDKDADHTLTVTLTTANGTLNNLMDANLGTPGIQLIGTASDINTALVGATFKAETVGAANILVSVTDGLMASPVTATYQLTSTTTGSGDDSDGATGGSGRNTSGASMTTDVNGNTTVVNNGKTQATVNAPGTGGTVTTSGTGDTVINFSGSMVTVNHTGSGTTTTTGISGNATVNISGSGAQVVDLSGVPLGQTITIDNNSTGTVNIKNLPDGVIVVIKGTESINLNDTDGASQNMEDMAPAMTGGVRGDGNGDGLADSLQSNVASVLFLNSSTAQSAPGNAIPLYVSLVADSRNGVIDTADSNSANLSNVLQLDRPTDTPTDMQMPMGLVAFTANVGSAGVTETFSLFVDANLTVNGYWKQNAVGTWVNLASNPHGGLIVTDTQGKTRLDFQIQDGGEFDADGIANGSIVDPGAAGYMPLSLVGYTPDLSDSGFWL